MIEPTINIQSTVDIRTLAQILLIFRKQKINHGHSWSNIVRECLRAITKDEPELSVTEALELIKEEEMSIKQLFKRGTGVKQHLILEDKFEISVKDEVDIDDLRGLMEKLDEEGEENVS